MFCYSNQDATKYDNIRTEPVVEIKIIKVQSCKTDIHK